MENSNTTEGGNSVTKMGYMEEAGYNYEVFSGKPYDYGLWDVPSVGEATMPRLWAAFYKMIKFNAVGLNCARLGLLEIWNLFGQFF